MTTKQTHTPDPLEIVATDEHSAVLIGPGIRVFVDCRERFSDPLPVARQIAHSSDGYTLAKSVLAVVAEWRGIGLIPAKELRDSISQARKIVEGVEG